jgi:translation initiation factor 2B subunit (eIF-2B alpha/beta/delta family)
MSRQPVTIREVARLSGVSVGTVSNVLNGRGNVREATQERVEGVIRDLGYTPDVVARSLISRRRRNPATPDPAGSRLGRLLAEEGLPAPDQSSLDLIAQILDQGALGATRHLNLAHRLLLGLAERSGDAETTWRAVRLAADLIVGARGQDSPVVANGVTWLIAGAERLDPADRLGLMRDRVLQWRSEADQRLERLVDAAVATLGVGSRPLLLDYSSTVSAVIEALQSRNLAPAPVVLECRATGGGMRYLHEFVGRGLEVRFLPDTALEHALSQASAVLVGCESLRADGSIVNALGSRPLARTANALDVPVYCCADLYKLDLRSYGHARPPPSLHLYEPSELDDLSPEAEVLVDRALPLVEAVPARFVTRIISDAGSVEPSAIWKLGEQLFGDQLNN